MTKTALESGLERMSRWLGDPLALARWRAWLGSARDESLARINAHALAEVWEMDVRAVLTELIQATKAGVLTMIWEVVCPACGASQGHNHLESIDSHQQCRACGQEYHPAFDRDIEVHFQVHPGIRELPALAKLIVPRDRFPAVSGLQCGTLPAFRELMGSELIDQEHSLQVLDVSLMFTDIQGSTSLYSRLGDSRAFAAVRGHFHLLFHEVATHGGVVVKTIGDAIMAGFSRPVQAMNAALAVQNAFRAFRPLLPEAHDAIELKIGLHRGPCIAVTLNDRLDYFGGTVNLAARTQQTARGGEIRITESMRGDPDVRATLDASDRQVHVTEAAFRGLSGTFKLHVVSPPADEHRAEVSPSSTSVSSPFASPASVPTGEVS